jgi:hypothetical protein
LQPLGDDAQRLGGWLGVPQFHLVEKGPGKVLTRDRGQGEPKFLAG